MNKEQMSIEDVEDCAKQIVEEAIVFNKIPMQQKNLWISKILDHIALKEDKQQQLDNKDDVEQNSTEIYEFDVDSY